MVTSDFKENDRLLILKIKGDILSTNAEERAEQIGQLLHQHQDYDVVRLDMNTARMIDSVGLNMLLGVIKMLREQKAAEVILQIASPSINRVLNMSRFDQLAKIRFRERRSRKPKE